jgi:predicted ATPase/DNA-binding winged helix-turn-helix (wHTH) protein
MSGVYRFADFELHAARRLLLKRGHAVQLGGRAMDLLVRLVEQRDRIVAKAELLDHGWPGQAVEPNNLAVQMWALRRVLGAQAIATVAGRGYRFVLPLADDGPAPPSLPPPPTPTPTAEHAMQLLAPMIGRERELAQLLALLQAHRLVTLLGPPGVGKTRLAQAALAAQGALGRRAQRVDLAAASAGAAVEDAVRLALGLIDSDRSPRPAGLWARLLDGRPWLLLLDNCEHRVAEVAALASEMLLHASGVTLLATSQQPLRLAAEQQMRLAPLPTVGDTPRDNPALQLLVARARALDAGFALADADLPLALELCRRLDGLPLAIELAAVRLPALGLRGVHARLHDGLHLLTQGTPAQRHATLADALSWSVSLLDPPMQALFAALGVFKGSFGIELALAVGEAAGLDEWAVLDGVSRLIDHSLLVSEAGADAPRLRLLETVRAYASRRLRDAGDLPRLRRCHAQAVRRLLAHNGLLREQGGMSHEAALQAVRAELDNVRAAVDWVLAPPESGPDAVHDSQGERAQIGHSIVADAWPAMMFIGLHHELVRWMLALLPYLEDRTPPRTAGFLLLGLGKIGLTTAALPPRQRHAVLLRAQALLDPLPRTEYAMAVRQVVAQSACQRGEAAAALAAAEQALALVQRGDLSSYRADLMVWRGIALALLGRTAEAEAARAQALPLCVPEGHGDFLFMLLCDLAELEALLGLHAEAAGRWRFLAQAAAPAACTARCWRRSGRAWRAACSRWGTLQARARRRSRCGATWPLAAARSRAAISTPRCWRSKAGTRRRGG